MPKTPDQLASSILESCPHQDEAIDCCRRLQKLADAMHDREYALVCQQAAELIANMRPTDFRFEQPKPKKSWGFPK